MRGNFNLFVGCLKYCCPGFNILKIPKKQFALLGQIELPHLVQFGEAFSPAGSVRVALQLFLQLFGTKERNVVAFKSGQDILS
jgi:hypothetical protein